MKNCLLLDKPPTKIVYNSPRGWAQAQSDRVIAGGQSAKRVTSLCAWRIDRRSAHIFEFGYTCHLFEGFGDGNGSW
jgi:hypothetical protein